MTDLFPLLRFWSNGHLERFPTPSTQQSDVVRPCFLPFPFEQGSDDLNQIVIFFDFWFWIQHMILPKKIIVIWFFSLELIVTNYEEEKDDFSYKAGICNWSISFFKMNSCSQGRIPIPRGLRLKRGAGPPLAPPSTSLVFPFTHFNPHQPQPILLTSS